ncbi:MAG: hypothetical protein EAZ91_22715 [Cytophagales bacterium]|nr:MAG: hypothetical protein EAZ91_22715 [Cytophagales bacterium]
MRTKLLFLVTFFLSINALAQSGGMMQTTKDRINFSGLIVPATGVLFGVEGEKGKLIGDNYYDTTFQAGNVRFYGRIGAADSLGGVPLRYDLYTQEVEIRASPTDIRAAKAPTVRYFVMNNRLGGTSLFVNAREYRGASDELVGFLESLTTGKFSLLQRHSIIVKTANFNAALNVGTKDDELVKKREFYVAKGRMVMKFSPSKKAILELMASQEAAIEAYLKEKKPDLKKASGLAQVFEYYNTL